MLVIRSQIGKKLVEYAHKAGVIKINAAEPDEVRLSQNIAFKKSAPTRVWIRQLLGLPVPVYKGKSYSVRVRDIFSYGNYFMSYLTVFPVARLLLPTIRLCRWIIGTIKQTIFKVIK